MEIAPQFVSVDRWWCPLPLLKASRMRQKLKNQNSEEGINLFTLSGQGEGGTNVAHIDRYYVLPEEL